MKIVKLENKVENGSTIFSVEEENANFRFSDPQMIKQLEELYRECYQLNSWRIFDKSEMNKEFKK